MDILELAYKIINGKRLCREDNTDFFASCDLPIVVNQTPRLAEILCF